MDASLVTVDGYTIVRVVGRGGMGVVYEAIRADGERVALKVIAPEHTDDVEYEQRFGREAKLAAQLEHPHIVPVIDSGRTTNDRPYLVFAYIDGTDLDHRLREHGALQPGHAARTIAQVAGALDVAHRAALVHRDVKPANVPIRRSGDDEHVYLTDFGLARRLESSGGLTGTGQFTGTPGTLRPGAEVTALPRVRAGAPSERPEQRQNSPPAVGVRPRPSNLSL